ncbi:MAG: TRAFs-binding domain-containing protein [Methylobacter sp.]|nr:TRAFs-binding domain-containing protein [Methylobacter sp.]
MKTCFVVQGFGKKTDYTDGRVLDLDASYEVIKEAVESAELECVRADEIIHSGTIDVPMYERLLNADLVIADLSTYNVNAAFELGVRYALRPYTTIVLAEEHFKNPFDMGHIVIRRYQHLGGEVGFREAKRLMAELKKAINAILDNPVTDSPVYTYIPHLQWPLIQNPAAGQEAASKSPARAAAVTEITGEDNPSAKFLLDSALEKINANDFMAARILMEEVRKLRPKDSFVLQQLALATYKSKQPTDLEALQNAYKIMQELKPATSNNPETLGLWGAIHKRLWELTPDPGYLNESISAYERGFYLKQDYYNGINLAYLLNLRAVQSLKNGIKDEAVTDFVLARRVRRDVIRYATPLLDSMEDVSNRYWLIATLYEAAIGVGDEAAIVNWENKAKEMKVADWMQETRINQADKLKKLMQEYKDLSG